MIHDTLKVGEAEFLKAAIMQSHNCANYLRICFFSGFTFLLMSFLTHVPAQNFPSHHFDCAEEIAFRESGDM